MTLVARSVGRWLLLAALLFALATGACGGSEGNGDDSAGDISAESNAARELFASKGCAECHGADGEGTDTPNSALAGTRMIIQQFETRVRNGRGSAMPAHSEDQITDEEIATLHEWLQSLGE